MPTQVGKNIGQAEQNTPIIQVPEVAGIPEDLVSYTTAEAEEVVLEWEAPNRVYKSRTREYYSSIAIIVFLLSVLLYFANQYALIAVTISIGFLSYVFAAVPPTPVINQITTYGVRIGKKLYPWDTLNRFWTTLRFDTTVLHIEHNDQLFRRITLIVPQDIEVDVLSALALILPAERPEPTFIERAGEWLQEKFPLERE